MVRIAFVNFWPGYREDRAYSFLTGRLFGDVEYTVVDPDDPEVDVVFGSVFGSREPKGRVKVLFLGENWPANFAPYDFSLSHYRLEEIGKCRNLTWPLFAIYYDLPSLLRKKAPEKTDFCAFVVSNPNCPIRNLAFQLLSAYRHVNSGGRYLNNTGGPVEGAHSDPQILDFLGKHKFNICFENSSAPGYCTEKLVQSMAAGTIPVYWGDPTVGDYFNTKSFVHVTGDLQGALEEVKVLDTDPQAYERKMAEPWIFESTVAKFGDAVLREFRDRILEKLSLGVRPVGGV